jgi:hypothetical protein
LLTEVTGLFEFTVPDRLVTVLVLALLLPELTVDFLTVRVPLLFAGADALLFIVVEDLREFTVPLFTVDRVAAFRVTPVVVRL